MAFSKSLTSNGEPPQTCHLRRPSHFVILAQETFDEYHSRDRAVQAA